MKVMDMLVRGCRVEDAFGRGIYPRYFLEVLGFHQEVEVSREAYLAVFERMRAGPGNLALSLWMEDP